MLELEVQEYYDNPIQELPEIINESQSEEIIGETLVKQDTIIGYLVKDNIYKKNSKWSVSGNDRVRLVETLEDGYMCRVRVYPGAVGTYIVSYGDYSLEVTID